MTAGARRLYTSQELARAVYESVCRVSEKGAPSLSASKSQVCMHRMCALSLLPISSALAPQAPAEYSLPDGRTLQVGAERLEVAEHLFSAQERQSPLQTMVSEKSQD